ncbi:MAG: M6 family metalloprotease domain-containing protein [candidate division Zixibacteria bacterium]|nr:M6 family metalloprotease domain-containing protein [candidate division Zixibacteria bacterium]MDD5425022.1 M6 family metalloprotease domain-containing protein [candidate division Zixibacteria bacterium]
MERWKITAGIIPAVLVGWLTAGQVFSVPPDPQFMEKWKATGIFEEKVKIWKEFINKREQTLKERPLQFNKKNRPGYQTLFAGDIDTLNLPVILVEFTDHLASGQAVSGTAQQFDSILFSVGNLNPTGSMTDYFLENAYGSFFIKGDVYGWYTMPQTYKWYVSVDYGLSRSGQLALDALLAARADINFAQYDYDEDGYCDGLIIIHAGQGAEQGGNDIWSHQSWLPSSPIYDGVIIDIFSVNPEEFISLYEGKTVLSPIGVFCHEFGHILGLPALYDINDTSNTSEGLGCWSLMAAGSYNGGAKTPAHLDPWCKIKLGFVEPFLVTTNLKQVAIPAVETTPVIFLLPFDGNPDEYWLVENRRKTGFDSTLPGTGLLIYHIDEGATFSNSDPYRYHVALEQADGLNSLAFGGSSGDYGDPWPGINNNRNFHALSVPDSKTNIRLDVTEIGVWNISEPGQVMYADLDISFSRPYIQFEGLDSIRFIDSLSGNHNGLIEQGETIELYVKLKNMMLSTGYGYLTLQTSASNILILQNEIRLDIPFTKDMTVSNNSHPVIFTVPDDFETKDVTFRLFLIIDSTMSEGFGCYRDTLEFIETVGQTEYLVVSSGHSEVLNAVAAYKSGFGLLGKEIRFWDRSRAFPDTSFLENFKTVIWTTDTSSNSLFEQSDIEALEKYLDKGNNLLLSTPGGLGQLANEYTSFVSNYLHLHLTSSTGTSFTLYGITGNEVGEGLRFFLNTEPGFNGTHQLITPYDGGQAAFALYSDCGGEAVGVSYSGHYKTLVVTYLPEMIRNDMEPEFNTMVNLLDRVLEFMGGNVTAVEDDKHTNAQPGSFTLYQNYPNPFNPVTVIKYTLHQDNLRNQPAPTRLAVYDLLGREIKVLVAAVQPAGNYEITWDATDEKGDRVATGVYFYKLEQGNLSETKKMMLLK